MKKKQNSCMPYLSIIQVYITPEVLARGVFQNTTECIQAFLFDLHMIMDEFLKSETSNVAYRIYQSLTAGDFTVVIRSQMADTSFNISTAMRKRVASNEKNSPINLVLYKTYTILSLYDYVISSNVGRSNDNNKFVIRCCFTNKYWSEKSKVEKDLTGIWNLDEIDSILSLNGRYDFTVELTEKEFHDIFKVISKYKGILQNGVEATQTNMEKKLIAREAFQVVDYLCYLITRNYVSYVNERYLLCPDSSKVNSVNITSAIKVVPVMGEDQFLLNLNEEKYQKLKIRFEKIKLALPRINCFCKNLHQYFVLLEKLFHLCQTINGLSDTRIYAAILLEQLQIVLDGLDHYIEGINIEEVNTSILAGLESYLIESVCALDSFAGYIRNNNLQSLQTPNYSLQSNASMEKILIGYGEFLLELIEGYRNSILSIGNKSIDLLPVLVPVLSNGELSVEVMFSDTFLSSHKEFKKLMVVKCSTLQELTNVPVMIAAFFHEIAHQFRYEDRKTRNQILVCYGAYAAFGSVIKCVVDELYREVHGIPEYLEVEELLHEAATEAFGFVWKKYIEECEESKMEESSLSVFQMYLKDRMIKLWQDESLWNVWKVYINDFLEEIKTKNDYFINLEDVKVQKAIMELGALEKKVLSRKDIIQRKTYKEFEKLMEKSINNICYLWRCAYSSKYSQRNFDWKGDGSAAKNINECCLEASRNNKGEILEKLSETWSKFDREEIGFIIGHKYREMFLAQFYENAHQLWKERIGFSDEFRRWGRYLGLDNDTKENRQEFIKLIQSKMDGMLDMACENMDYAIESYREWTSDIYMCTMLELTPFGYLNFMAYNLPEQLDGNNYSEYISRLTTVILSVWIEDETDSENACILFSGIHQDICRNLKHVLEFYPNINSEHICTMLELFIGKIYVSNTGEKWQDDIRLDAVKLYNECRMLRSQLLKDQDILSSELENILSEILHYQYLFSIIIDLIESYSYEKLTMDGYEYVKHDLRKGVSIWIRLRSEFEKKPWWKYCRGVGKVLGSPGILYKDEKRRKTINDMMIQFLQEMYYQNKRKSGNNIIKEGVKH